MKQCPNCNANIVDNASYCLMCGVPVLSKLEIDPDPTAEFSVSYIRKVASEGSTDDSCAFVDEAAATPGAQAGAACPSDSGAQKNIGLQGDPYKQNDPCNQVYRDDKAAQRSPGTSGNIGDPDLQVNTGDQSTQGSQGNPNYPPYPPYQPYPSYPPYPGYPPHTGYGRPGMPPPVFQGYGHGYGRRYPMAQRIESHLVKAIIATACCCLPFGIFSLPFGIMAIVYAVRVNTMIKNQDTDGALEASQKADVWANLSIGIAVILLFLWVVVSVRYGPEWLLLNIFD